MRDLPYINVAIINKMWIVYLVILLLLLLSSIKFKISIVSYLAGSFFLVAFILTLLGLTFFAEAVGILIYFSLWIVLVHKIITFFRDEQTA